MKIQNLDGGDTVEIELLDIYDVASQLEVQSGFLGQLRRKFEGSPKPVYKLNGRDQWTADQLPAWSEWLAPHLVSDLNEVKFSRAMLIEKLLEQAKTVANHASRAYSHSRIYNKKSVAIEIHALEGLVRFVSDLRENVSGYNESGIEPAEKRQEINELILKAKSSIGMV